MRGSSSRCVAVLVEGHGRLLRWPAIFRLLFRATAEEEEAEIEFRPLRLVTASAIRDARRDRRLGDELDSGKRRTSMPASLPPISAFLTLSLTAQFATRENTLTGSFVPTRGRSNTEDKTPAVPQQGSPRPCLRPPSPYPHKRAHRRIAAPPGRLSGPDALGRFGLFGGRFVPETLMDALNQLAGCL